MKLLSGSLGIFILFITLSLNGSSGTFTPFVDPLPIPPVIKVQGNNTAITVHLTQFSYKIHRDYPAVTEWGYNGTSPGPTIEVQEGQKVRVHWKNDLPTTHIFKAPANEMALPPGTPDVRNITHLHGAVVTESNPMDKVYNNDGWPDAWNVGGQEQIAEYPNNQTARILWYHDHAIGTTGRNVAAGLEGMYIIRDNYEKSLNLPSGPYEIPLIISARGVNADGSLYYSTDIGNEYYGNGMFVNGKLYPYLNVEPRKYRFRILNASNARTVGLSLLEAPGLSQLGPVFYQIGSDSGFLEKPVVLNDPNDPNSDVLTLAPAERADVIIDFSKYAGKTYLLHNSTKPDDADHALPLPQIMLINVGTTVTQPDTSQIPATMKPIVKLDPAKVAQTRQIVFAQMDMSPTMQMLQLNGKSWTDPITEKPVRGTTEVWELVNTLTDTHPFHIHLVQFQVLNRQYFDVATYNKTGQMNLQGPPQPPDLNEQGWKDTVRVVPNMITRIIMQFSPYAGYYVYHCHILEHEDMDMMRPFEIVPPGGAALPEQNLH